jgi:hypothetical protein
LAFFQNSETAERLEECLDAFLALCACDTAVLASSKFWSLSL